MKASIQFLVGLAMATGLLCGCAGPEQKLGRGLRNTTEIVRWGELRRTVEQTALFDSPDQAYTTGLVRGFNRSMARFGVGLYEIVTAPFPPYEPVATRYLSPEPVYPDNYKPDLLAVPAFDSANELGFSGGDVAPMIPNSRFKIFDR
ncbi:exosortase system-associated protein, TIGR04073 family [Limisphaera sp. VF-2]|jgi:putative exosortase-associated protein (TIGR04073 family)|uniref:exosortase system-associated protein, TIGR04073 family n=1 Tax=Limisphaera sp. VF-2 TaxID=3400418 RepID=UPI0017546175|nr:exosortase system-associated protein, TIGR04073 family [Limisphaera sp.]